MEIKYKLDKPNNFSDEEKKSFVDLLKRQSKVSDPTIKKVESCPYLCIASCDNQIIGIGALKQVSKTSFDYAEVVELKSKFKIELGYLYVEDNQKDSSYRGLGIGKSMTRLLLDQVNTQNIFATTEIKETNPMLHILSGFGFKSIGKPYVGRKTHDIITLMILIR